MSPHGFWSGSTQKANVQKPSSSHVSWFTVVHLLSPYKLFICFSSQRHSEASAAYWWFRIVVWLRLEDLRSSNPTTNPSPRCPLTHVPQCNLNISSDSDSTTSLYATVFNLQISTTLWTHELLRKDWKPIVKRCTFLIHRPVHLWENA